MPERVDDGIRVETDGVRVEKGVQRREGTHVVKLRLTSPRDGPVAVRLREPLPENVWESSVHLHPDQSPRDHRFENESLLFETVVPDGGSQFVTYAIEQTNLAEPPVSDPVVETTAAVTEDILDSTGSLTAALRSGGRDGDGDAGETSDPDDPAVPDDGGPGGTGDAGDPDDAQRAGAAGETTGLFDADRQVADDGDGDGQDGQDGTATANSVPGNPPPGGSGPAGPGDRDGTDEGGASRGDGAEATSPDDWVSPPTAETESSGEAVAARLLRELRNGELEEADVEALRSALGIADGSDPGAGSTTGQTDRTRPTASDPSLGSRVDELAAEVTELRSEVADARDGGDDPAGSAEDSTDVAAEIAGLRSDLEAELSDLREVVERLEADLEALRTRQEQDHEAVASRLDDLEADVAALNRNVDELDAFRTRITRSFGGDDP